MQNFFGATRQNLFYGWYLKCETDNQVIAMIPAIHQCDGKCSCSIQVITDENTYSVPFPAWNFYKKSQNPNILKPIKLASRQAIIIGENIFCDKGIKISLNTPELVLEGKLIFGELTPLKYDVMGPFVWIPFMECRHSVYSMHHVVKGELFLNGKKYVFNEGRGYWEGDRGYSFPREYLWTQCLFGGGSLMLSVAEIPFFGGNFTGVIGVVFWQGKEYRFATYLGARVRWLCNGMVRITQGDMVLEARLLEQKGCKQESRFDAKDCSTRGKETVVQLRKGGLRAPVGGEMNRTIHEHVRCLASYRFRKGNEIDLNFESDKASFEYEYRR